MSRAALSVPLFVALLTLCVYVSPVAAQSAYFSGVTTTLSASFVHPTDVAVDSSGNVYVSDRTAGTVSEIPAGGGGVSTLATGLNDPFGVAVDGSGNIYVANYAHGAAGAGTVQEIPGAGGSLITLASGYNAPDGVAVDSSGNVYFADYGDSNVYEIPAGGGSITALGGGFNGPEGLAVDRSGNIYIADVGNGAVKVMDNTCSSSDCVTTLASGFSAPEGVAVDRSGNVYFSAAGTNSLQEIVAVGGTIPASPAIITLGSGFNHPIGLAVDYTGDVFVANYGAASVLKIMTAGINLGTAAVATSTPLSQTLPFNVTTAGTMSGPAVLTNGAASSDFSLGSTTCSGSVSVGTCTVTVNFTPTVSGTRTGAVELLNSAGTATVATAYLVGSGTGPQIAFGPGVPVNLATNTHFGSPQGVAVDGSGNVYVADSGAPGVYKIPPGSTTATPLGSGFASPTGVAVDGNGDLFVADPDGTTGNKVTEILAVNGSIPGTPTIVPLGASFDFSAPSGAAVDSAGNVYVADPGTNSVYEILAASGYSVVTVLSSSFNGPRSVAVDGSGNVYVADSGNNAVKEIVAVNGQATASSAVNPLGGGFTFDSPNTVAVDGNGNVYVGDKAAIYEIPAGTNEVNTLAGGLSTASGVAVDANGNVYYSTGATQVVELALATAPTLNFPQTSVGGTSATQSLTLENNGNEQLTFTGLAFPSDYIQVAGTGTPADCSSTTALAQNAVCNLGIAFKPTTTPIPATETIGLTANSLNGAPATQSITLNGTAVSGPTANIQISSETLVYGSLASFTPVTGANGTSPYSYSVLPALPTGLTMSSSSGAISGTPMVTSATTSYTVTVTDSSNATATASFSLTVAAAPLTITASSGSFTYGGTVPAIMASYSGFVNGDTSTSLTTQPTCTTTATSSSPASPPTYSSSCSGAADPNYTISYVNGSVTVTARSLTITASSGSFTYGGTVPAIAASYSGFVNGDTSASLTTQPTCTTTATSSSPASPPTYPSSCSGAADSNYTISYVNGSVTVTARSLTITASSGSFTYGGTVPAITASYSGFVNGDTSTSLTTQPTCTTTATSTSPVSPPTYPSSCSGAADQNYTIGYVNGSVTINAAPVTATAGSYSGVYNGSAQSPTACVLTGPYTTGLNCTDNPSSVGPGVDSGTVMPAVSGVNSNFAITTVNGSWSITQASSAVTISFAGATNNGGGSYSAIYSGSPFTPSATVNGVGTGITQTVTWSGTCTTVTETMVPGCTAMASYAGDANHTGSSGSATLAISQATPLVTMWPTASAITYGQTLGASILSGGTASVLGSFAWTAPGAVPLAGTDSESVTFVPSDPTDYSSVTGTVNVTVNPASYIVTVSTDDAGTASNCTPQSTPGHGTDASCSLRDALLEAAATGGGNIGFDATAFSAATTIELSNGALSLPSATTIAGATTGSGATLANLVTVDGQGASTVFTVVSGVTGASLANLTIQHGSSTVSGGGIENAGTLTLSGDSIIGNTASGTGAGGGIYNSGTLAVSGSTISGNTAGGNGGGIVNSGTLTLVDDTISGNSASGSGGGIYTSATLVVSDSTLSGNTAGTASGGGGIDNAGSGSAALANAILSGNSSNSTVDDFDGAAYTDNSGNVVGVANGATVNGSAIALAPLGSYGGPAQTMIPLPGSAAICAGLASAIPSGVTTDERGLPNSNASYPGYPACVDAGAVQTNYALIFTTQPAGAAVNADFAAGVTLNESGSPFPPAVTIPLTLTGNGTLSGGTAATSSGVASYTLQVSAAGSSDALTANLTLNGGPTPAVAISAASNSFAIGQATPTVGLSVSPASVTYGTQVTFTATVPTAATGTVTFYNNGSSALGTGTVSGGVATFSSSTLTVGSYSITASYSGDSNYNAATSSAQSLTVNQATATISISDLPASGVYGGSFTASYSYSGNGSPTESVTSNSPGVCTVSGNLVSYVGVGTCSLTASATATTDYTAVTGSTQAFPVTAAALTITASSGSFTYGGTVPAITASYSGFVNGDTSAKLTTQPACSTTASSGSPVSGSPYPSSCTGAADPNYTIGYVSGSVTENAAPLTITASSGSFTYGGTVPAITASYSGFVNGDTSAKLTTQPACSTTASSGQSGFWKPVSEQLLGGGGLQLHDRLRERQRDGECGGVDDHGQQRVERLR